MANGQTRRSSKHSWVSSVSLQKTLIHLDSFYDVSLNFLELWKFWLNGLSMEG